MSDALRAQVDADLQDINKVLAGSRETREKLDHTLRAYANLERSCAEKGRRIAELEAVYDAILPLYHAANCLVGQADSDSTVATVLTPALVAYEQAVTKGKGNDA